MTVDRNGGRNQETLFRLQRTDTRNCSACHDRSSLQANYWGGPMYEGVDLSGLPDIQSSAMTWDTIKRMRDTTKMKVVLKGILAHEDAELAVKAGVDAHHRLEPWGAQRGQRAVDHRCAAGDRRSRARPACRCSWTAASAAAPISPRRCAWARPGVCIGRPYIWGLGAFGQPGVERVLELLRIELLAAMQQVGAPTIKHLVPAMVRRA